MKPANLPHAIKSDIADVVQMFEFTNCPTGGNCIARAVIGHAVLLECGFPSRLVAGSLLYRVGVHPQRDTLRFCLRNNKGGYHRGFMVGHVWNELGADLIDFSAGDWRVQSQGWMDSDPLDGVLLGPVQWTVEGDFPFIWQARKTLADWRPTGEPPLGGIWYGGWNGHKLPNYTSHDKVVADAKPYLTARIAALGLRERIDAIRERPAISLTTSRAGLSGSVRNTARR